MKSLNYYLTEYAKSHQNPTNIKIHNVCVPLIAWSVIGFCHTFPMGGIVTYRFSHVVIVLALIFYASLKNFKVVVGMFIFSLLMLATFAWVPHLRLVSFVVFDLAWVGQFYGHKIEGKKPSFFQDLLFLLIGPVWVLKKAFRLV